MFGFTQRIEAEAAYKQAVANANDCQYQVHISQVCILIFHAYILILLMYTLTEINSLCLQKDGNGIRPEFKRCQYSIYTHNGC